MSRPQAVPTVQVDNERVTVTEWRFAPGAETGAHRHGYDYVITPITDGNWWPVSPTSARSVSSTT
jgi:quercetin dioxygenase-like cupin family protein